MKEMQEFREIVGEIQDLRHTQGLLGWDLETFMPEKGAKTRSHQLSTLAKLSHQMLTSDRMGALLDHLRTPKVYKKLKAEEQATVREWGRDYDREKKIPVTLVQAMTQTTAEAMPIWAKAREAKRFEDFAPILEKILKLNRELAETIGYTGSPYNALLDLYEPELTTETLDALFGQLKRDLVPLVGAIQNAPKRPNTKFLHKSFNEEKQLAFSEKVLAAMGFDLQAGRLDKSVHPFSMGMGSEDVRLTTRVFKDNFFSCLASTLHEGGHGLYEQNSAPSLERTGMEGGTSLGIHESQSRLWENLVGRSKGFWKHFFPKLKKVFPKQLEDVSWQAFYKAINLVEPSPIRVEADEVTYNLHIILRYEIEKDLIEGKLDVKAIPAVWNRKMKEYLGYFPKDDAEGALQDVHWSHGSFGYFPTYTLGNLYSVQFYNTARRKVKGLEEQIAKGKLLPLKNWLAEEIHRVGRLERPAEIVQRVTGGPLDAQPFVDYLWDKYSSIYEISRPAPAVKLKAVKSARR